MTPNTSEITSLLAKQKIWECLLRYSRGTDMTDPSYLCPLHLKR